jgi:hypothetical protein
MLKVSTFRSQHALSIRAERKQPFGAAPAAPKLDATLSP